MARKKKYEDLPERSDPSYMKLYKEKNKEELKRKGKEYIQKQLSINPDFYREKYKKYEDTHKKWREENRHIISEKQWKSRGIIDMTYEKFLSELEQQEHKCLICEKQMNNPQVDHDHVTGLFRGILCVPCNNGLGIYERQKDVFENYLNRWQNE
jgi:hypothetical protein